MTERAPVRDGVDRMASLAGRMEPPPLPRNTATLMVRHAVGEARRRRRRRTTGRMAMAAVVLLGATGVGWWSLGRWTGTPRTASSPMRLVLPTGDRVAATPGARFEITSVTHADRRIRLEEGTMLFDVVPLSRGQRFEVTTGDLRVRVRGTVFSVRAGPGRSSSVHVYEGRVAITRGRERVVLHRGDTWPADANRDGAALTAIGRAAVRRRDRSARHRNAPPRGPRPSAEHGAAPVDATATRVPSTPQTVTSPEPMDARAGATPLAREAARRTGTATERNVTTGSGPAGNAPSTTTTASMATARRWLLAGDAERALRAARAHRTEGAWGMLEADALRALHHFDEAARVYDVLAWRGGPDAAQAGYLAAQIRFNRGDEAACLHSLDTAQVDAPGSPLEERGLGLRARALLRLGRREEARAVAARYLAGFPHADLATWMRAVRRGNTQAGGSPRP